MTVYWVVGLLAALWVAFLIGAKLEAWSWRMSANDRMCAPVFSGGRVYYVLTETEFQRVKQVARAAAAANLATPDEPWQSWNMPVAKIWRRVWREGGREEQIP